MLHRRTWHRWTGLLTLRFLPNYAPEPNPDELVLSHLKRKGFARTRLRRGGKLKDKIEAQLTALKNTARLMSPFFIAPRIVYITG
jgi:transposase